MSIGPILGVRLVVHRFAFAATALVAFGIFVVGVPGMAPFQPASAAALGLLASLVLVASYSLHELAHVIVARRRGMDIDEVTLFGFVGRSPREQDPPGGATEVVVAAAGLAVTFGLAIILFGVMSAAGPSGDELNLVLRGVLWWSAVGNLALGGINALPAYPYDGGRIIRGALWAATGNKLRATRVAAGIGRIFAQALLFSGALYTFVTGNLLYGLWLVATGFFLLQTSRRQYRRLEIGRAVEGLTVEDVMDESVATVGPNLTLDTLYGQFEREAEADSYPVTSEGVLIGSVDVSQVRRVPRAQWARTRVAEVMTTVEHVTTVTGRQSVMDALLSFDRSRADAIPVVEEKSKRLVGVLIRDRVLERLGPRVQRMRDRDRRAETTP